MKHYTIHIIVTLCLSLLAACNSEAPFFPEKTTVEQVQLNFTSEEMSRSAAIDKVHDFWFLQFDATERLVQKPYYCTMKEFSGTIPVVRMGSPKYTCIFIANVGENAFNDVTQTNTWASYTLTELKSRGMDNKYLYKENEHVIMSGMGVDEQGKSTVTDVTLQIKCPLVFNQAKITLKIDCSQITDVATFQGLFVQNVPQKLLMYKGPDCLEEANVFEYTDIQQVITFTHNAANENKPAIVLQPNNTTPNLEVVLFVPNNPKGKISGIYSYKDIHTKAPQNATNLVLKAGFKNEEYPGLSAAMHMYIGTQTKEVAGGSANFDVLNGHWYNLTGKIISCNPTLNDDSRIEFYYDVVTVYVAMEDYWGQFHDTNYSPLGDKDMNNDLQYTWDN